MDDAEPLTPADVPARPDLLALHPSLWRANQVGQGRRRTRSSGFAALDAELPGGGWPHGELTELLLPQPGLGELRLLAPALAGPDADARQRAAARAGGGAASPGGRLDGRSGARRGQGSGPGHGPGAAQGHEPAQRCVMLFDPPARLSAWALAQHGLDTRGWVVVQPRERQRHPRNRSGLAPILPGADVLWALEQALRSGHVDAVLAWLPLSLRADALRRLQLAAQAQDGPVFVFREAAAAHRPSPAPLRLLLQPAGVDGLSLRLIKRRGPPLAQPLRLLLPPVLTPGQQAHAASRRAIETADAGSRRVAGQGRYVVTP